MSQFRVIVDPTTLLIQCVAGAFAGNLVGVLRKGRSLGPALNTVLGAIGGVAGGSLLGGVVVGGTAGMSGTAFISGGVLPIVIGWLRPRPVPVERP